MEKRLAQNILAATIGGLGSILLQDLALNVIQAQEAKRLCETTPNAVAVLMQQAFTDETLYSCQYIEEMNGMEYWTQAVLAGMDLPNQIEIPKA